MPPAFISTAGAPAGAAAPAKGAATKGAATKGAATKGAATKGKAGAKGKTRSVTVKKGSGCC
jgi:hypothetical protein